MIKINASLKVYKIAFRNYPDIMGIDDLCKMLNIGKRKAYAMVKEGIIPKIPGSRTIKIAKISVIEYVLQNAQN